MTSHNNGRRRSEIEASRCPWLESAATYAAGALPSEEAREFAAHLERCAECKAELELHAETLAQLDLVQALSDLDADPTRRPSPGVRARLVEAVERGGSPGAQPPRAAPRRVWQHWSSDLDDSTDGILTVAGSTGGWIATDIEGIEVKRLSVDPIKRIASMLIRMAPGSRYPSHRHASREECFVIAGDLRHGRDVLRAGDYQVAEQDSVHDVQSTDGGCVLFISSSQDDELV